MFEIEFPDEFKVLTKTKATYHKQGKDHHMHHRRPIIELDENAKVRTISYSPPFEGPLEASAKQSEPYFRAFSTFTKIINRSQLRVDHRLKPGDLISFNNRRVLHAREAFASTKENGERHLQGTYIDTEIFESKYRALAEKLQLYMK